MRSREETETETKGGGVYAVGNQLLASTNSLK